MDISIVICTRNRAHRLGSLFASLAALKIPAGLAWELVLVDNGSSDDTQAVIDRFQSRLPFKRVFEPTAGVSHARNAGAAAAQGRYIVCTDDDVRVDPDWLLAYLDAFEKYPDAMVFGGKITPVLQPPTPLWFAQSAHFIANLLGKRDFGGEVIPLSISEKIMPYGANYAVRAAVQKQYRFNTDLGVTPTRRMGGEETDMMERILATHAGWWVPGAEVQHIIPPAHQTTAYIFNYYAATGEHDVYLAIQKGQTRHIFGLPLELCARLIVSCLRYYPARLLGHQEWVRYLASYAHKRGMIRAWLRYKRKPSPAIEGAR